MVKLLKKAQKAKTIQCLLVTLLLALIPHEPYAVTVRNMQLFQVRPRNLSDWGITPLTKDGYTYGAKLSLIVDKDVVEIPDFAPFEFYDAVSLRPIGYIWIPVYSVVISGKSVKEIRCALSDIEKLPDDYYVNSRDINYPSSGVRMTISGGQLFNLKHIEVSNGSFGFSGFEYCGLDSLNLGEVGDPGVFMFKEAFNKCPNLKEIHLNNAISVIECFQNCGSLKSATINFSPDVETILYQDEDVYYLHYTTYGNFSNANSMNTLFLSTGLNNKFRDFRMTNGPYNYTWDLHYNALFYGLPENVAIVVNPEFALAESTDDHAHKVVRAPFSWQTKEFEFEFEYRVGSLEYVLNHSLKQAVLQKHYIYRPTSVLEIPEYIDVEGQKYTVVGIGDYALANSQIDKIVVPETVENIADYAFNGSSVSEIVLPKNATLSCGNGIFTKTGIDELVIPNGTKRFCVDHYLSYIKLPESLIDLELLDGPWYNDAIVELTSLSNLAVVCNSGIWSSSSKYSSKLYINGKPLETLYIPEGIKQIPSHWLSNIDHITTLILPTTTQKLGEKAFFKWENLTSVVSKSPTAPKMEANSFPEKTYDNATLIVGPDADDNYDVPGENYYWYLFKNYKRENTDQYNEDYNSGISNIYVDTDSEDVEIFNLNGIKVGTNLNSLPSGLYIVRSQGKAQKVFVR